MAFSHRNDASDKNLFEIGQTVSEMNMLKSVDAQTSWTPDQIYAISSLCEQKTCCQKNCGQPKGNNAYSDSTKLGALYWISQKIRLGGYLINDFGLFACC